MRALIAGTGSIGRRHIANLRRLAPQIELAFLRQDGRIDDFSRASGAVIFKSLDEASQWQPEIAVIATPSDSHFELLMPLLQQGVATFIEKPVVVRLPHVRALAGLSEERLPPTQVGCVLRFLPAVRMLKSWIREGRCGNIVRATFEAGQYLPDWRPSQDYRKSYSASKSRGGGVLFDLVHEIDLAVFLLDDIQLLGAAMAKCSHLELECEDAALLTFRSSSNALVSIELDYVSRRPVRRMDIVGDEGTLRLDFIAKRLERVTKEGNESAVLEGFDIDQAYREELSELMLAVEDGRVTSLPMAEGLRATELAILAQEMAATS